MSEEKQVYVWSANTEYLRFVEEGIAPEGHQDWVENYKRSLSLDWDVSHIITRPIKKRN